jgi:hypothetical protein
LSGPESKSVYDEDWLQKLLYKHPHTLPVRELDDAFAGMIPLCREMTLPSAGDADIVYVTPSGRPVIVEAKLWRNPEARRKVVSQVLDYAKELSKFDFETFDAAVRTARRRIDREEPPKGLIDILKASGQRFDELEFRDALARNLKRGDMLLLIVGDGIREGVGAITGFLESFASLHFTFGLIEVAIYEMPDGGHLVQPRVLAQSTIVRRVVVELRDGQMSAREEDIAEVEARAEEQVSEEVLRDRERFRKFWDDFLKQLTLDNQEQPVSLPATNTNQYFTMPKGSNAWVSAYLMQSGQRAGVYLTFAKGPVGNRLYEALKEDKEAIEREIGIPVQWESDGTKHWISAPETSYRGRLIEDNGPAVRAMMADRVNRFVNVFRPRLEKIVEAGV